MKLYQIVLLVSLFFSFNSALAQNDSGQDDEKVRYGDGKTFGERLYFGGGLGALQFNRLSTRISVSPLVGYRITEKFSAGVQVKYQYAKDIDEFIDVNGVIVKESFQRNIYGGGAFSRLFVSNNIFLHAEYESLGVQFKSGTLKTTREWIPGAFVGGGYAQSMGNNSVFFISALYNVLYDEYKSPYGSPLDIQVGIALSY